MKEALYSHFRTSLNAPRNSQCELQI